MPYELISTLSTPRNNDQSRNYPVIFAIHGRGSDEQDMLQALSTLKDDCIIVSIRGPHAQGNGYSFFPIIRLGSPEIDAFNEIVEALMKFIMDADNKYPIDPTQKYLFGFSQGAILSMTLALKMGSHIRGIVALNGYIPKHIRESLENKSVKAVDISIFHGIADQIFPVTIGRENAQYFTDAGAQVTYGEYEVAHDISFEEQEAFTNWFRQRFI
ncbi:MAG: hypothetical protein PHC86_06400 [Eubacteriales bacterium]|nr:hypothetical protein [Eubacteriales bacterium]